APFFLGNGANQLVSDEGADVFAVKTAGLAGAEVTEQSITAQSGCLLSRLACFAQEHALEGLAFAHGIPGSLGGAVVMNAGAYGGEMAQVVESVTVLDQQGRVETLTQLNFSYRSSALSDGSRMILSARLHLRPGDGEQIRREMEALLERRRDKQPLELPSAGSAFRRPKEGYAAALIDQCGLKGLAVGGAQVSEKHAGFIVNRGGASCRDILRLLGLVRQRVLEQTGVALEPEVKLLGEEFPWSF
ncbi:MAG: UDP-N-acetylmuramate dehydrogenase, partial [Oscillospiraceae bacterium]|nr:UDP-N-acetylmuramate dehydrogenase [Oscillospiraceae bacterium]